TVPSSRTHGAGLLPRFRRVHVAFPEGPAPTLAWPNRVNGAALLAVVKDTIPVLFFAQRQAARRGPHRDQPSLFLRFVKKLSDGGGFVLIDPDKSRRSCATMAAARAGEAQAVLIPWFSHCVAVQAPGIP